MTTPDQNDVRDDDGAGRQIRKELVNRPMESVEPLLPQHLRDERTEGFLRGQRAHRPIQEALTGDLERFSEEAASRDLEQPSGGDDPDGDPERAD